MATGNSAAAAPCTTPFGDEATTVGRTGISVNVNWPPAVVVTGCPGSVTENVYVSGVADPPATPAKSPSSSRTLAPIEGGGVLPLVGTGKITFTCPDADVNVFVPPFWSVNVMIDADEILGASK